MDPPLRLKITEVRWSFSCLAAPQPLPGLVPSTARKLRQANKLVSGARLGDASAPKSWHAPRCSNGMEIVSEEKATATGLGAV